MSRQYAPRMDATPEEMAKAIYERLAADDAGAMDRIQ